MASSKNQLNFKEKVYEIVVRVPKGKVTTYGEISKKLQTSAQMVGWMLHLNKSADVPCHRVVDRNGRLAPNFGFGGYIEQKSRLEAEGVEFSDEMHVDLDSCLWQDNPI